MTVNKKKKRISRHIIALVAIMSILLTGGIIANAATDGAVAENISSMAQSVAEKISFFRDFKEVEFDELEQSEKEFINEIISNIDVDDDEYAIRIYTIDDSACAAVVEQEDSSAVFVETGE